MADFLDDCQDYFGTKSLYEVLGLPNKTATQAEITSAYRKTSLKVHPDRAPEDKKEHAKKAFQTLTKVCLFTLFGWNQVFDFDSFSGTFRCTKF